MSDPLQATERTTAFRGGILTVGMRWLDRLMGFVSTMILARLLVPEDFGLVAMAMVVVGLLEVLMDLGVASALINNTRADAEDFHTAWTIRLIQSTAAAILLFAVAPIAATYYEDTRVEAILKVIAISAFIGGLENIGTVSFLKNMEFGRDFRFFVTRRAVGVVFTIAAAFLLRSYWALILGSLVTRITGVCVSYWMSTFRPRLSLARFSTIWAFSQWNLVLGIGNYLNKGIGRFVIGRRDDAATLGAYSVGEEIALLPTTELLAPLGRVMYPVFAAARHDASEMLRLLHIALAVQAMVAIPAGVGLALVARDAVPLLLGPNWMAAVPYLEILALASIPAALSHSGTYMLMALGRLKMLCAIAWARALLLVLLVLAVFPDDRARGVALATLLTSVGAFMALHGMTSRAIPGFGAWSAVRQVWRPLVSTAVMCVVVHAVSTLLEGAGPFVRLVIEMGVGALAYGIVVWGLWRLAGAPAGAETYLLEKVRLGRSGS